MLSPFPNDDDHHLMRRIQAGERVAFAALVTRHHLRFYRLAYRQILDADEAEDIVQECFIKLWQKPELFRSDKGVAFSTWFARVVINRAHDSRRKRTFEPLDPALPADEQDSLTDQQQELQQALLSLPSNQRSAVNLCFYEGHSNQEAADMLGVRKKALESILMRAKAKLKQILNNPKRQNFS